MRSSSRFRRLWAVPILLAFLTIVGLISALLGDGIWDALSWVTLVVPIAIILRAVRSLRYP